jgi:hypothetical protein
VKGGTQHEVFDKMRAVRRAGCTRARPGDARACASSAHNVERRHTAGSVLVFPKQLQGTVTLPEGGTAPATELESGVVCPKGVTCSEHQAVKIRLHWVCGTTEAVAATSFVCQETDFDVTATVWEKIVLTPNGEPAGAYGPALPTVSVPAAQCPLGGEGGGFMKVWFVSPTNDQPIKFDGLIGDALIRTSGTAQASYNAIPIQADPALANGAVITTTRLSR